MRNLMFNLFFLSLAFTSIGQETINGSLTHDGLNREYILYVPANYTGNETVPLILNFHGYTSNAGEQMFYGDFRTIADTAGFIVVHPEGTLLNGETHWNVGGWTVGSTVDDIGFSESLIEKLSGEYSIDQERIYSTGMSNGGFMSYLLACQLGNKIAAIASVTGSMTPEIFADCNPEHPTPILEIHGTNDGVVPYNGAGFTKSIDEVLSYWVDVNDCNAVANIEDLPDLDMSDQTTAIRYDYGECANGISTSHIKIVGGGHTWPGTIFNFPGTNQDIDASLEIWKFFSRYDINGAINTTAVIDNSNLSSEIVVSPNPVNDVLYLENIQKGMAYTIYDHFGKQVRQGNVEPIYSSIDISSLNSNLYFLRMNDDIIRFVKL